MRFLSNDGGVQEIVELWATPVYKNDVCCMYSVSFVRPTVNGNVCEDVGEYILDGTTDCILAAKKNFDVICEKALLHGYFRHTDFVNFSWY